MRKLFTAAFWGAAAYLLILLLPLGTHRLAAALKTGLQILGNLGLLQLAFSFKTLEGCLRAAMAYAACACLLGGGMTAAAMHGMQTFGQVLLSALLTGGASMLWLWKEKQENRKKLYTVCLQEQDKKLQIKALLDSGNSLWDPLGKLPVCVVTKRVIRTLGLEERPERYRAIPYHSVGKMHGMLSGWTVENMYIRWKGQELVCPKAVLAVSENSLSLQADYDMLLHPALLEEKKGENHDFESCDAGKDAV